MAKDGNSLSGGIIRSLNEPRPRSENRRMNDEVRFSLGPCHGRNWHNVGLRRLRRPSLSKVKSTPGAPADIFVSYTRRDQDRVVTLVQGLQAQGFRLWMDQAGIEGATLWSEEIVQALRGARVVLFFASPPALASPHVMREISLASEENKKILPVFLEAAEVPPALRYHLAGIQHLQVEHMATAAALEAIQRALHRAGVGP